MAQWSCMDSEGGGGGPGQGSGPPWEIKSSIGFHRNQQLNTPWKMLDPLENVGSTLENVGSTLEP